MQTKVIDLGVIRLDDISLIISQVVDYYERSLTATNVIFDDEMDRLVNENRRDMTKSYLTFARNMRDGINDPNNRYSQMTAYDAAKHLAAAAEWYGKCLEATNRLYIDREATIAYIKKERARKAASGYTTW